MKTLKEFYDAVKALQTKYGYGALTCGAEARMTKYAHIPNKPPELVYGCHAYTGENQTSIVGIYRKPNPETALELLELELKKKQISAQDAETQADMDVVPEPMIDAEAIWQAEDKKAENPHNPMICQVPTD